MEDNSGIVVGYENCVGAKQYDRLVVEDTENIWEALADRYLNVGCSVMLDNKNRFELLGSMIEEYKADAAQLNTRIVAFLEML